MRACSALPRIPTRCLLRAGRLQIPGDRLFKVTFGVGILQPQEIQEVRVVEAVGRNQLRPLDQSRHLLHELAAIRPDRLRNGLKRSQVRARAPIDVSEARAN